MIRTVLVPLAGADCDLPVLEASARILSGQKGHIECLRLNPDPAALIAQAAQVDMGGWMILSDTVTAIEQEARERTKRAQSNMSRFCQQRSIATSNDPPGPDGISVAWREETGDEFDQISHFARYHDLVVLAGGSERPGRLPDEALGGIIMGSGRPILLVPQQANSAPFAKIAVAWKDVPEAARAVTAALPLLEQAQRIDVFTVNESDKRAGECVECYDNVVRYFRWHGLNANGHLVIPAGRAPADAVLDSAREAGADLLVMGAYGHSRVREFVFGGFTQRVLKGVELPVLLFH